MQCSSEAECLPTLYKPLHSEFSPQGTTALLLGHRVYKQHYKIVYKLDQVRTLSFTITNFYGHKEIKPRIKNIPLGRMRFPRRQVVLQCRETDLPQRQG